MKSIRSARARGHLAGTLISLALSSSLFVYAVQVGESTAGVLLNRAKQAQAEARISEAILDLWRALEQDPHLMEARWYLATLLLQIGEHAQARPEFERFLENNPQVGPAWAMLGICEYHLGSYEQALEHLLKGHSLGLGNNEEFLLQTQFLVSCLFNLRGDFEAAERLLRGIVARRPQDEELLLALSLTLLRRQQLSSAVQPDERSLLLQVGRAGYFWLQREHEKSESLFTRLVHEHSQLANLHYAHGRFLAAVHKTEEAMQAFSREIESSPDHVPARIQLVFLTQDLKGPAEALPLAQEVVRLAPDFFVTRYALGSVLLALGENQQAISELEKAARLSPSSPQVHFALARAYQRANRLEDAQRERDLFKKLQESINPGSTPSPR